MTDAPILVLDNARISYFTRAGEVNVIPGLSFALASGEAMGLVGESGCGKSTVAYAAMRYLPSNGKITSGSIVLDGRDMPPLLFDLVGPPYEGSFRSSAINSSGARSNRSCSRYPPGMDAFNSAGVPWEMMRP